MTKAELYYRIRLFRRRSGLRFSSYPINAVEVSAAVGIRVEYLHFRTPGLRGVAFTAEGLTVLDAKLGERRRNFYAAHELCHHICHKDLQRPAISCYDAPQQDDYIEWQANEGAAELLVPYRIFLPTVKKYAGCYESDRDFRQFRKYLAEEFKVGTATIEHRFDTLKYELDQYLGGVPLADLDILSDAQQRRMGIESVSLNDRYLLRAEQYTSML